LLGPLEKANLNHWSSDSRVDASLPSLEETLFSGYLEFRTKNEVQKPSTSDVILRRQNHLDSIRTITVFMIVLELQLIFH
jgi:hypothetical protein